MLLSTMNLVKIYLCLCDEARLRILNPLKEGGLCVCHFQEILGEPQVKISKHSLTFEKTASSNLRKKQIG